jgi:uncharacterized protein YndB with AHSA1/START domain
MIMYEVSETIQAEPKKVFEYLSHVPGYAQWMNVSSVEVVDGEGRGQRWRGTTKEGAFLVENDRYEVDRLVGFRTIEGPMDWTGTFRVEPLDAGGSRVTSAGQIKLSGLRRLLEPIMAGEVRKGEASELLKLKGLVESGD